MPAFEFLPTLDGGTDAIYRFGSEFLWAGEFLEFDQVGTQVYGVVFPTQAAPLLQDIKSICLSRFDDSLGVPFRPEFEVALELGDVRVGE